MCDVHSTECYHEGLSSNLRVTAFQLPELQATLTVRASKAVRKGTQKKVHTLCHCSPWLIPDFLFALMLPLTAVSGGLILHAIGGPQARTKRIC